MSTLPFIVRMTLLFVVLGGIGLFWKKKWDIHVCFIPVVTVGTVTSVMFVAGLLNMLSAATYALIAFGIVCFVDFMLSLYRDKSLVKEFWHPGLLFFVLLIAYFAWYLNDVYYIHYDNFSHWGRMVKEVFYFDALPDYRSVVDYQNYPPGTALFIYFVCKIIGYGESYTLMAQSLIYCAAVTTLSTRTNKNKWVQAVPLSLMTLIVLESINKYLSYSLLVDMIISVTVVAIVVIVDYYRDEPFKCFVASFPVAAMVLLIKDSGKVFLIFLGLVAVAYCWKKKAKFTQWKYLMISTVMLWLTDYSWDRYVLKAYPVTSYNGGKFEVTNIDSLTGGKSQEFLEVFPRLFMENILDFSRNEIKILWLINAIVIALILLLVLYKRPVKSLVYRVVAVWAHTVFYTLSLVFMYLTMMPESEASYLAGFTRYYPTGIVIHVLLIFYFVLSHLSMLQITRWKRISLVVVYILPLLLWAPNLKTIMNKPSLSYSARKIEMVEVFSEYGKLVPRDSKTLVSISEESSFLGEVLRYETLSRNSKYLNSETLESSSSEEVYGQVFAYDYLVVLDNASDVNLSLSDDMESSSFTVEDYTIYKTDKQGKTLQMLAQLER